jgi:hypothetical protein
MRFAHTASTQAKDHNSLQKQTPANTEEDYLAPFIYGCGLRILNRFNFGQKPS